MGRNPRAVLSWAVFLAVLVVLAVLMLRVIWGSGERYRTTAAFRKMEQMRIEVINDEGETVSLEVKVADEEDERRAGFAFIGEGVIRRTLILVIYEQDTITQFRTADVVEPLDLAFMRSDGVVVDVVRTQRGSDELYTTGTPFKYVLEARAGFFEEKRISRNGARLRVETLEDPFRTTEAFRGMGETRIKVMNSEGEVIELTVKVADEQSERLAGFQHIGKAMIERSLILFVFEQEIRGKFHMRNVVAPLDIAFIAADGAIVEILRMEPGGELYGPDEPFRYALEARAGFFREMRIRVGEARVLRETLPVIGEEGP